MSKVFTITEGLENMGALRTGGQGSVYKGRRFGPILSAVKLLPTPVYTESTEDKNFISFQNEVEKLKKVNERPNPNVVRIINSGITESGSFPFIEMEFIEGPDLEELLQTPQDPVFTVSEVIRVAGHLASALAHCHGVGVKHGDIKSNNVKFNIHTGNYVLLDFGLSAMSDEQRRTSIRHAGAIEFMAPEQSEGQLLFETDIYSYGVILFELLAGQVPFPLSDGGQKSRNEVLVGHLEMDIPDVLTLRRGNLPETWSAEKKQQEMQVPEWLLQVIYTCLEKKPENRYASGLLLQEALDNRSAGGHAGAELISTSYLQQENERLTRLLESGQEAVPAPDTGVVVISKPVFYVGLVAVLLMLALLSYFLIFKTPEQATQQTAPVKTQTVVPDTPKSSPRHNYSWDKKTDTVAEEDTEEAPEEDKLKFRPVPQPRTDTTVMDLDTTLHF